MDVREYIESGILEAYILGALPAGERAEVEANIAGYPELQREIAAIERAMQSFAEAHAEEPAAPLQDKIWGAIEHEWHDKAARPPAKPEPKVIPLSSEAGRQSAWQRAAIWAALLGSVALNIWLWSQRASGQQQDVAIKQNLDSTRNTAQQTGQLATAYKDSADTYRALAGRYKNEIAHFRKEKEMVADPGMQMIVMRTTQKDHPMGAMVYWSKATGEAYVSIGKMPAPPKGMQYQLWVIQKGKPVSMGMLPNAVVTDADMKKLDMNVTDGQAFAISLEKEGGSPTPTAANIYVMGKVNS